MKKRGQEPTDTQPIGRCPAGFTAAQKTAWREITANDPGVLQKSDRVAVETTSRLLAEIRGGELQASKIALLTNLLHKLGQTPVGRNYVQVREPEPANPFDED